MDVKRVQAPSFGAIRISQECMPSVVKKAIMESSAVNNFGKRYNAEISYALIKSSKNPNVNHPALMISDITPAGIFRKFINKFKKNIPDGQFFYLPTRGTKDSDLGNKLTKVPDDYLIKEYESLFNK